MRVSVIVNEGAGAGRDGEQGVDADTLRAMFRQAGMEADVRLLPGEEILGAAREAVAPASDAPEAVVAGGGDGTIRSVASALVGTGVPLGVLPLGTLNHFARDLGVPADLEGAVRLIAEGTARPLDVGEVNGEIFINNSQIGLYPPMVKVREREREQRGRGKWSATLLALLKVLPRMPLLHLHIRAEGLAVDCATRFAFIGNNEYEMSAFSYGARSRFDSGNLYLYVSRHRTRLGLLGLALLGLFRDVKRASRFDQWCLPELTIEAKKPVLSVYLDGEVALLETPLRYRARVHELQVIMPAAPRDGSQE